MDLRRIPVNDVVYAIPLLLWLASFATTRWLSLDVLRSLSLRFNLVPTAPQIAPADMDVPENIAAVAAAMQHVADGEAAAAAAARPDAEAMWMAAAGVQRRRFLRALLCHPARLFDYWRQVVVDADDDFPPRWTDRLGRAVKGALCGDGPLATAVSCATSLLVHANSSSLLFTMFSYLRALSSGQPCAFPREAVADMLGAFTGAIMANGLMVYSVRALNRAGESMPVRETIVAGQPWLRWTRVVVLPALHMLVLLLNATSSLTMAVYRNAPVVATTTTPDSTGVGSAVDGDAVHDAPLLTPEAWARAAGAVEVRAEHSSAGGDRRGAPRRYPPVAYFSGGEGFSYAFAGFRFAYRGDVGQLQGAAWSYMMDAYQNYKSAYLWVMGHSSPVTRESAAGTAEEGPDYFRTSAAAAMATASPFSSTDRRTGDVFFTNASSEYLSQQNVVALLSGCVVGLTLRAAPRALRVARTVPIVRQAIALVAPPPLPPIAIPDGLMEATLSDLGVVRLFYVPSHSRHAAGGKADRGTESAAAAAATAPHTFAARRPADTSSGDSDSDDGRVVMTDAPRAAAAGAVAMSAASAAAADAAGSCVPPDASADDYADIPVPPQCFCPITRCLMSDPVQTVDGFTYDREAIAAWLSSHATSPMTNLTISTDALTPNVQVRAIIIGVVEAYTRFVEKHHHPHTRQ